MALIRLAADKKDVMRKASANKLFIAACPPCNVMHYALQKIQP